MDFEAIRGEAESDETPEDVLEGRPGCLRSAGRLALFLLVPALAVAALLPTLMSADGGRRWALAKVNAAVAPASVSFEKWSLGWFSPPVLENVSYADPERALSVKAGRVVFDRGLLRLLPVGTLNVGEVTLENPVVEVFPVGGVPRGEGRAKDAKRRMFFLPIVDVAGGVNVAGGRVAVSGALPGPFVAEQVEGGVKLVSWRKPILIQTRMRVGGGLLALEGRVQSIRDFYKGTPPEEPETLTLKLVGVELAAFRPLLQHAGIHPWIHGGTAEGALTGTFSGKAQGRVEGGLMVSRLSVAAPGRPPSPKGDVAVMVDVGYDGAAVKIAKFDVSSPWLRADASGTLQTGQGAGAVSGAVRAKAAVFLAALARDFAPALGLSGGFKMSGGELRADVAVEGDAAALRVNASAVTEGLAMTVDGAPLVLKPAPSLSFKATFPHGAWPEVEAFQFKAPFADVYASGRFDAAAVKAQVDLTRFSRDFKRILKSCPPMVGAVYLDAGTKREGADVAVTSFLRLTDVAAELQPGQIMVVQQGTLKFGGRVPLDGETPRAEMRNAAFDFTLADGRASGGWERLVPEGGGQPLLVRGFSLTSDMEMNSVCRLLGGFIPAAAQRRMTAWRGRVLANATAEVAGDAVKARMNAAGVKLSAGVDGGVWNVPDIRMEGSLTRDGAASGLRVEMSAQGGGTLVQDGETVFAEPSARVALDATLAPDGNRARVAKLDVASSLFSVMSEADVTDLQASRRVAAKGMATVDFGTVTRLLHARGIDEFTLTGRGARAFTFASPVAGGLSTVLAEGELAAAARVDSCKGLGLNAGPADVAVRLSGGVLKAAYEPALNGGRLRFVPEVTVGGRGGGVFGMPAKTRMLENVTVTQEMIDTLLVSVNPLFWGSTVLGGTVTLDVRSCRVESGLPPEKGVAVEMDVLFKNLKLNLGPTLRELLGMINVKERTYEVAQLPVRLAVRDGRIQTLEPVTMVIERQPIIFNGWMAFDERIGYKIEIPVTERLAGVAARALKGVTVTIPVTGTVREPQLDTRALQNMLGNLLKGAAGERAVEKVGTFLENLQRELKR
jgi:hypothetical protein